MNRAGVRLKRRNDWVLVCAGSHAEIPLITTLRKLGFRVVTSGNRPQDLGHTYADAYRFGDFSNSSELERIAREFKVVGIISACNDFAAIAAAEVAQRLNLPGHDNPMTSIEIHHKDLHKQHLRNLSIRHPESVELDLAFYDPQILVDLKFPLIVKPVDLTGGKGMTICSNSSEITLALERVRAISRSSRVVIEEYLFGTQHGVSMLLVDKKVRFVFTDDEQYGQNTFLVAGTTSPSSLKAEFVEYVVCSIEKLANHLGLVDGLIHCQVVANERGVFILETCRRCPGDLYPTFVELATDFAYTTNLIAPFVGLPIAAPTQPVAQHRIARFCIMSESAGIIEDARPAEWMTSHIVEQCLWWTRGEVVEDNFTHKLGIAFARFPDCEGQAYFLSNFACRYPVTIGHKDKLES